MPKIKYQDLPINERRLKLIDTANAIIGEYSGDGYTLTLRQLYYQFVARGLIENSERSYKNLGNVVADGRMVGLIDWYAIEDRGRGVNPWLIEEDERGVLNGIEGGFALDYWSRQETYVEVWVEKEALSAVVQRPCERFRVPYMACKGYMSASEAWRAGRRFRTARQKGFKCVLIHLGDHDPSGLDMTRDNDDRVDLFGGGGAVDVRRIALNMDQVQQYRPPENPAKVTDSRAAEYIARYGDKSWELDALNPRVLDKLITDEIKTLIDANIWNKTATEEGERREILAAFHDRFEEITDFLRQDGEYK